VGTGDAVAVVRVEGAITASDNSDIITGATSGRVIADLETASADETVKAILLRVDSPGGSVTGSAQIYEALLEIEKPVVVSMAGTAASGGYYVSAPADYIIARPDTFTGSLGVIITTFNADELIADIGVDVITITSGENKDFASPWSELPEEQRAILEGLVDEAYADFVRVVAEGRDLSEERVREIADGRIYSGRQALELGLVDALGNFDDGLARAAELGGISGEPRVIEYERTPTLSDVFLGFSARLERSTADEVLETVSEMALPLLEYRYVGPGQ
jgi:protease-4